jgi:hypothetical protein
MTVNGKPLVGIAMKWPGNRLYSNPAVLGTGKNMLYALYTSDLLYVLPVGTGPIEGLHYWCKG